MKSKYPKRRKSPYHHKVRSHTRQNRPVRKYVRGKGDQPRQRRTIRKHSSGGSKSLYSIILTYIEAPSETLSIDAPSYIDAVNPSLEQRASTEPPIRVRMRRVT